MIETCRGVVYPAHLDHMGHMNVQWYTARFDEGTWHLFAHVGLTGRYLREAGKGMAAVHQAIDYEHEALVGDLLVIRSTVERVDEKAIHFRHCMQNAETDQVLAQARLIGVHFDLQSRRACPFPQDVLASIQAFLDAESRR